MAKRSFRRFVEQELGEFPQFLVFAMLEWVLIIILFIDGFFAFLANEFAKFFELQIPCLLCTRIDHVITTRNPDFYYNDSICESHKKNVSSLAFCHAHKKLSEIRTMCEGCLLSFATERECDCDTYKSLVGILHKDLELLVDDDQEIHLSIPVGKKDDALQLEKSSFQRCSCCGEPLKVVSSNPKGKNAGQLSHAPAPAPSPRASFVMPRNEDHRNLELPHIRYTELKFSDNESELPEDEDGLNAFNHDKRLGREDIKAATVPLLTDPDDVGEDKTPNYVRGGNKFFGIPLSDSAQNSPRWTTRFHRKSLLERTENTSESTEGNASSEGEGDSILHHLKRQVRLDRKSLMALYMELDEERSASAVAANNAMAMITRLQAEKAAVQMEALQYQRMMEEQAEYDQEALQAMKDLLTKREEEIKELEAELEAYREKYGCIREDDYEGQGDLTDEDYQEMKSKSYTSYTGTADCNGPMYSSSEESNNGEDEQTDDETGSPRDDNGGRSPDKSPEGEQIHRSDWMEHVETEVPTSPGHRAASSESSIEIVNDWTEHQETQLQTSPDHTAVSSQSGPEIANNWMEHGETKLQTSPVDRAVCLLSTPEILNNWMEHQETEFKISPIHRAVSLQSSSQIVNDVVEETEEDSETFLTKELYDLRERIQALKAESGLLPHVPQTLSDGSESTTLLTEISSS